MKTCALAVATLAFTLSACNQPTPDPVPVKHTNVPIATSSTGFREATSPQPPPLLPSAIKAPHESRDPAAILQLWRKALETHDYASARAVWGNHGEASGQSSAAFAAAWDKYRIVDITVGKGTQEGAAGSSFYEAPVTITGLRRDGKPYHLSGSVTLRRVNDVDGATPEQLRWHIESSTLRP